MSYLNTYRTRLNANGDIISNSKNTVNNNFSNSLFSELVLIDDVEYEVIITQGSKSEDKKILLKPDTSINIGAAVKMNNVNYLVVDFLSEGINEIYPTATLKLCNSTFPIQSNKTSVLIGHDHLGRPVYKDEVEDTYTPCIVESQYTKASDSDQFMIPEGKLVITLKYQSPSNAVKNYEFEMYGNRYKVMDVDLTKVIGDKGIMKIIAEKVV